MPAILIPLFLFASALAHGAPELRSIAEIAALTPEEAAESRDVHIFAIVTYPQERGSCFVQDDTGAIFVGGVETSSVGDSLLPGDRVEIRGITDPGRYRPIISHRKGTDLDVRFLDHGEVPEPRRIPQELMGYLEIDTQWVEFEAVIHSIAPTSWGGFTVEVAGRLYAVRIRNSPQPGVLPKSWFAGPVRIRAIGVAVRAELIEQTRTPDFQEFILRSGEIIFHARLAAPANTPPFFPLSKGSIVEASGICHGQLTIDYHLPVQARTFTITMRDAADMRLISSPPWWTVRRLGWILGGTTVTGALAFVWAVMLRKRVERQTAIIGKQIERQSVLGERQRIARELHDTLEQELAGISMQLDSASRHLSERPEETRRALQIAGRMLRHSREESRSLIVELRSMALEHQGLAGAIKELLRPLVDGSGMGFQLQVRGEEVPLAAIQGNHLLRIAQEAVSNATRHSRASCISVILEYSAAGVSLEVTDDGCGFTPEAGLDLSGHFGLLGMQERAAKLRTRLTIRSEPRAGTSVRIAVPPETFPPSP